MHREIVSAIASGFTCVRTIRVLRANSPLKQRGIVFRFRLTLHVQISNVRHYTDDFVPFGISLSVRRNTHSFSDNVQGAPKFLGHRFIHEHDFLCARRVSLFEFPPADQRNAQHSEIARRYLPQDYSLSDLLIFRKRAL